MAPLPGQYLEYWIGIGKDLTAQLEEADFNKLPINEKWERIYIKECIGRFLGLNPASPRFGTFDPSSNATNAGRSFAYRKQKGSKAYQFGLIPGTKIPVAYGERQTDGSLKIVTEDRTVEQFQLSLPRTCSVAEVIQWAMKGTIVNPDGSKSDTASSTAAASGNNTGSSNFNLITYIITPAGRKHPIRGVFDGAFVPEPLTDVNQPGEKPVTTGSSGG